MKLLLPLLLLLCVGWGSPQPKPVVILLPEIEVVTSHPSKVFLTVTHCNTCTVMEFDRIKSAAAKTNEVVRSQCFKDKLSAMSLIQTNGRTPLQVVEHILNSEVKIEAEMYWTVSRVLGYTLEGVNKEWINRRYMMSWGVCDLASLLGHETSHKIGYDHDYKPTNRRPNSVPYSINTAFSSCCHK